MKTSIRKANDPTYDADTITALVPPSSGDFVHPREFLVYVFEGHDGVPVVQIDTEEGVGRIRVNLNDGPIWDADPEGEGPTYPRERDEP